MARKTATIVIDAPGRDLGKAFLITEMSAVAAEKWALRALMALTRGSKDIPDNVVRSGMLGVLHYGLSSVGSLSFSEAEPLLDDMMSCVSVIPDPRNPNITTPIDPRFDPIEEITTRVLLRAEVFKLHTDFFRDEAFSTWARGLRTRFLGSTNTSTSAPPSAP